MAAQEAAGCLHAVLAVHTSTLCVMHTKPLFLFVQKKICTQKKLGSEDFWGHTFSVMFSGFQPGIPLKGWNWGGGAPITLVCL